MDPLIIVIALLTLASIILQVILLRRSGSASVDFTPLQSRFEAVERGLERTDRTVREDLGRGRDDSGAQARALREEVQQSLQILGEAVRQTLTTMAATQNAQLAQLRAGVDERLQNFSDSLLHGIAELHDMQGQHTAAIRDELAKSRNSSDERHEAMRKRVEERLTAIQNDSVAVVERTRNEITTSLRGFSESVVKNMTDLGNTQNAQLTRLGETVGQKMELVRTSVDDRLKAIQQDNTAKLDQMRKTVDEQLQGTLEKRLGESFQIVSERLEQVYKGLGEMQALATGVGDLKKVLSNVRARGTWGEVQLGALLEEMLSPDQYARNVATAHTSERVEFAIRFPGPQPDSHIWMPLDAKFPQEDYLRLVDAMERADASDVEICSKQLEQRIRECAKDIREKYIFPPLTTDFGVMYLPTESLYAEVLRRPGFVEKIQHEYRITIAGPTTLAALLNSLRLGFRTLAIQKRSGEVWDLLGAVKTEFGKYSEVLDKVKKKLTEAANTVDKGLTRTRAIQRQLKSVEELPAADAAKLLPAAEDEEPEEIALAAGG